LFRTKFTTTFNDQSPSTQHRMQHHSSTSIATKKNFSTDFHTNSQLFTRFHHQKTPKNTKIPKIAKNPKKPSFWGYPPTPPKNPYFPGFSGPPKLHKFAQICTNLHQFAPPKHHFWGVPNLPGPSG